MRIASQRVQRQDDMLHRIADVAEEAVAPIVETGAVALAAADRFDLFGDGIEAKVATGQLHDGIVGAVGMADRATVAGGCAVDFVVEAPAKAVHDGLDVVTAEAGEDLA